MGYLNMNDEEYTIDISTITTTGTITVDSSFYADSNYDWVISDTLIDLDNITIVGTLFEDTMPDAYEVTAMCKEYPGLEKAYENFKAVYKMVEQDWRGKQKEE